MLITGVYGSGKSSVAEEMAAVLEGQKLIEERLSHEVTTGRRDDLREAETWVAASFGVGIEDLTVPNDRPTREVAMEILNWLGYS